MISPIALRRAFDRSTLLLAGVGALLSLTGLAVVLTHPELWPISVATLLSVPLLGALAFRRAGAEPERTIHRGDPWVRRSLERLDRDGYHTWSAVDSGQEVIDHVVVGPTGIFVIRAHSGSGRLELSHKDGVLRLGGRDAGDLVWKTTRQAVDLRARLVESGLRVHVHGVVALTHASLPQGSVDMGKATFVDASQLAHYIRTKRTRLGKEQIDRAGLVILKDEASAELTPSPSQ
jgi:Nuclease-related domain